jgi:HEAT repeat protein
MDATAKKIVGMLSDERMERRCAAAMVLAELRLKESEVVEALGRCLAEDHRLLQLYALEALAGSRAPKVAGYVTPLLDHPDEEVRTQAAALLASQGSRAAAALAKDLLTAPLSRRRAIVSILARNHDGEIFHRLCQLLPDAEIGEYTLNALRSEVEHLDPDAADSLRTKVTALLKDKMWLSDAAGTGRALRLLGYLGSSKTVKLILPFASEKNAVPVRLAALAALRRPLAAAPSTERAVQVLLGYTDDPDATLARAALDTLRGLKLPEDAGKLLLSLAEGRHAETRRFALEALGRSGNQSVMKSLLGHLAGDDPAAREAAASSLARMEGAGAALVKELETAGDDLERVRVLCRLVRRHPDPLKPASRQSISDLAQKAMDRGRATAEPLLDLLAAMDPEGYAALLTDRALAHKRAKRYDQALTLLSKLEAARLLDDEGRYAALVSGLASRPSKKELGRASRTTDPVLRFIVALLENGDNVAKRMVQDKSLTPDDLFYIGFNFVESKDEDEKEFGGALLAHLAAGGARTKLGRSAKNKLHLVQRSTGK